MTGRDAKFLTSFLAVAPGESRAEREECVHDVEECPGDDDDVVDVLQEHHGQRGIADTLNRGQVFYILVVYSDLRFILM